MSLFGVTERDSEFYETRLRDFLPEEVIDIHTHVWLDRFRIENPGGVRRAVTWPSRVAADNPVESLAETFRLLLPGKRCGALVFGYPDLTYDVDASNDYVGKTAGAHGYHALLLSRPEWDADEFARRLAAGPFLGAKVYLNFAPDYLPGPELRILDFAPHHQLEVLAARHAILMLHIPREGRLRDPVNLRQLREIEAAHPGLQIVVAHVGRAYCDGDLGDAFERLADAAGLLFDLSANTNATVFEAALRAVGPSRLLFGSDLPITRMRMRRECRGDRYVNVVPAGLYGDVSGDPNMSECSAEEGERLTFFLYEEIDAFRHAAERVGLDAGAVREVFCGNAQRVLAAAGWRPISEREDIR